jgi:hypothetical protein
MPFTEMDADRVAEVMSAVLSEDFVTASGGAA